MSKIDLRSYQIEGVRWLTDAQPFKLLADDMGLGKTPQAIVAANWLSVKTLVIVCPATLKIMWARRLAQWSTIKRIYIIKDGASDIPPNADAIIVNYDLIIRPKIQKQLKARGERLGYDLVIFDESRALKEIRTKRTKACLGSRSFIHEAKRIWLLDGTPLPNRPVELYPILAVLAPHVIEPYNTYQEFGRRFCRGYKKTAFGWDFTGHSHIDDLQKRLDASGFFLRRTKEQVMTDLPDKVESVIELDVSPPSTLDDAPMSTVRRDTGLAKLPAVYNFVSNMLEETDKIVLFAHHRDVLRSIMETFADYDPVIVYGGLTPEQKQHAIDGFVNDPNIRLMVAQTLAGGSGVDGLQDVCNTIVFVEPDWSPGVMDQAIDRCRRIGQRKETVFVYYLVVPDSLDTIMNQVLEDKRLVINRIIKAKGHVEMTIEASLASIAESLAKIANTCNDVLTRSGTTLASSEGEKTSKRTAKKEPPAQEKAPEPKIEETSLDAVLAQITEFLAGSDGDERLNLIEVYKTHILKPIAGVDQTKNADPSVYDALIAAMKKGPAFYGATNLTAGLDDI